MTWGEYGEGLEARLSDLHGRIHRGAYQAQPSRRVWIPKADGRQRPLGIAALEDKVVQRAVGKVLNQIWEEDFLGFSYGFRPGRSQHDALDALSVGIVRKKVNWVLDLDVRSFFDRVNHDILMSRVARRIGDKRLLRIIRRFLQAGMMQDGVCVARNEGTPQGGPGKECRRSGWGTPIPRPSATFERQARDRSPKHPTGEGENPADHPSESGR